LPKADHIITVSNYSKSVIEEYYPYLEDKISVIYEASSDDFFFIENRDNLRSALHEKFGIEGPYVLFVGRFAPIKNVEVLVDWFKDRHSGRKMMKLVLVGRMDPAFPNANLEQLIYSDSDICVLQDICNNDLNLLYNGARFFYFASHGEGFGLPILESMAAGCPVLTSNKTSCPEIAGGAGILVDPEDKASIFDALDRLAHDDVQLRIMRQAGLKRFRDFSWRQCALHTYDLYKKMINESSYTA
jgi:glycosyltransferase involved in cell wall biosynthesis